MNVYNIIWADDEIDNLLDKDTRDDLKERGFEIVATAHDGEELETCMSSLLNVDAVIIDANFNESSCDIMSERDTSGLDYARSLYIHKYEQKIPFFLYTNRSDEMLRDKYKDNYKFLEDFPRHKRWFSKSGRGEFKMMLNEIKEAVEELKSPSFIVRNKFKDELNAASVFEGTRDFIFEFLVNEHENKLDAMVEPFVRVRRSLEKMFDMCQKLCLMPPIKDDMNGCANYFQYSKYSPKDKNGKRITLYEMLDRSLMPMPLANSLSYIVGVVQDGAHSKDNLKLKIDKYFEQTKDTLLLRSVVYILMDIIKWFTITAINHRDLEVNGCILWEKIE